VFYPSAISSNRSSERIVFTDLHFLNGHNTTKPGAGIDKHISMAEHIEVPYFQNSVSLVFAELNYADNADNTYEYQLLGDSEAWKNLGSEQEIVLANLPPGEYTIKVRVRSNTAHLASLGISVLPPLWRTGWAYAAYAILLLITSYLMVRNVHKYRLARRQFEQKIIHWENSLKTTEGKLKGRPQEMLLSLKEVEITSVEEKFLQRAIGIVEENMDDSSFDVDKFMGEMFMSRSQLHRKLKRVSGYSTTGFMRLIRLKRAAQLLKGNAGSVAEIAHKVGFENVSYFSKCFRETFGVSPSQYAA
jgi:AraC-like DNA-binding protein